VLVYLNLSVHPRRETIPWFLPDGFGFSLLFKVPWNADDQNSMMTFEQKKGFQYHTRPIGLSVKAQKKVVGMVL
jgi:hypothetical protein